MSAVFPLDQVLACTESATSEYSTTSQCLSALLARGRPGRVKFIPWFLVILYLVICDFVVERALFYKYGVGRDISQPEGSVYPFER